MQRVVFSLRYAVLLLLLSAIPAQAAKAAAEPAKPIVYTLPNGLTVILKEDHTAPVAAFQMWVKVGGADEPAELAGIAHVFEHMLFKGTQKRAVGQIGREVSAAGGDINAYTANDQTVYHLVLASRYFDTGLDILADATQNSSFDPVELKKELEVVVEEIRRGEDNADRALGEAIDAAAYKVHPYGRPVIGTVASVRSITRPAVLDFFHKWYVPNNMTLVVVGDFKPAEAKAKIAKEFKAFKARPIKHGRPVEPPQTAMRVTQETAPFQQEKLGLAFHIPSVREDDAYAMDVLSDILGGGSNGLLINTLANKLNIATQVYAFSYTPLDPGTFMAGATIDPKNREEVVRQTARIVFEAAHGEIPAERLRLAKTKIAADFIYQLETVQGLAGQLGYFSVIVGDLNFQKRYLDYVNALTVEKVAEVARKYLRPENLTLGAVIPVGQPQLDEARLRKIIAEEWAAAERRPRPLKVEKRQVIDGTTIVDFDNGTRLFVTPDSALPIVSVAGGFKAGLRYEPAAQSGLASFTAAMFNRGTESYTREQLADELDAIAGGFGMSPTSDLMTWSFRYLNDERGKAKGLDLMAEILLRPTFPADEVESLRKQILPSFAEREDNLFQVGLLQFLPKMFGQNGYGRMALGEKSVIEKVTSADVRGYYERFLRADQLVVTVVGDVNPDDFVADYARLFATHRATGKPEAAPIDLPPIKGVEKIEIPKGKAQSHIFVGWRGVGLESPDRYELEILNAIMAGMGGRLFLELRDHQSLAYSVTSILPMRQVAGAYIVYMASAPDKLDQAVKGIHEQIALVREKGVLPKEVEEAKRFLIGNMAVDLQTRYQRAASQLSGEMNGLGFEFDTKVYPEKIQAVTVEDVNRIAKKYLEPNNYVFVVVK